MSEASEDKTKRKFITLLQSYPWESKLNLYFDSQEFGNNIYEYLGRINRSLTTKNPDIGFLYRICINMTKKYVFSESKELGLEYEESNKFTTGVMITYFCQRTPLKPDLSRIRSFDIGGYKYTNYFQNQETIASYMNKIKREKPHNLVKYLDGKGQRYGILNKKCFTKDMGGSN
ncbi:hypothetical protein RJ41_09025 [Alteromonas marina]|uniref:Uncharacterized protein n=1 Tax=Alteromonas marina TaxID=203795 RepID=A0A0B3Y7Z3_9ALTE|nr:hypothetical protein [Alteromonas marina]KHT53348.1 hypothetical protein RJ41_09025 [Alteromonas marina]